MTATIAAHVRAATIRAAQLNAQAATLVAQLAEADVDTAVREGRIAASERGAWVANVKDAPGVSRRALATMPAGAHVSAAAAAEEEREWQELSVAFGW